MTFGLNWNSELSVKRWIEEDGKWKEIVLCTDDGEEVVWIKRRELPWERKKRLRRERI